MDATSCTLQWIYRAYLRETKEIRQPMHFLSHYILIKPIVWPGHPLSHWQNEIMGTPFLSKIALIQANLDWSVMTQASGTYICIDAIVEKGNERKRARGKEGKKDLEMKICVFTYQSANKLLGCIKGTEPPEWLHDCTTAHAHFIQIIVWDGSNEPTPGYW